MPVSLEEILRCTRQELDRLQHRRASLELEARTSRVPPSFEAALRKRTVAVIAELKRRSPSAGNIREDLDPAARAVLYAEHGASALSVLTDGPHFGGSMEDLKDAVRHSTIPVLRKDFILDEVQILEARAAGAAAVLLIVRVLGSRLGRLLRYAASLHLDSLVEVHTMDELTTALEAGATTIGVNSRDLDTFAVDVDRALKIVARVPPEIVAVAESGMAGKRDVERAAEAGADAVLVGTALSAAPDPRDLLKGVTMVVRRDR